MSETPRPLAATTGHPGLDAVLHGIEPGDNIVWEVEDIADYHELVGPYALAARAAHRRLIYFRFADHLPLLPTAEAEVHQLDAGPEFRKLRAPGPQRDRRAGRGAVYVFDCLSQLADQWGSDQALGNFFRLTCPRLWDLETVTYFGLYRDRHSTYALEPIRTTTQFLLDVFRLDGNFYIRPVKVQHRSREVMNTIHVRQGANFLTGEGQCRAGPDPVADAVAAAAKRPTGGILAAAVSRGPGCRGGIPGRGAALRNGARKCCGGFGGRCGCIVPALPRSWSSFSPWRILFSCATG
jgi:hypothetical protein